MSKICMYVDTYKACQRSEIMTQLRTRPTRRQKQQQQYIKRSVCIYFVYNFSKAWEVAAYASVVGLESIMYVNTYIHI